MSQRLSTSFISTNRPGAYFVKKVQSSAGGVASSGVVAIFGEAEAGEHCSIEDIKNNYFGPTEFAAIKDKYVDGNIVSAARMFTNPSSDPKIVGSVSKIYIVKTNSGTKAIVALPSYGTLEYRKHGTDGNKYSYKNIATQVEVAPIHEGSLPPAFGATLNGAEFVLRKDGEAEIVITLSATDSDHDTIANLVTEINTFLVASGIIASESAAGGIKFTYDVDTTAYSKGYGKTLEISGAGADLLALGLEEVLVKSSLESQVEVNIKRQDTGFNEIKKVGGKIALSIGYLGTTATVTVSETKLVTTVTGGSGSNLDIVLANYPTIYDLAEFISSKPGYTAEVSAESKQKQTTTLDKVTVSCASSVAGFMTGRIKKDLQDFKDQVGTSTVLEFAATAEFGLPASTSTFEYLEGGLKGSTSGANIVEAIDKLKGIDTNFVVPLFSQDASADILEDLTDSGSTYTIEAVNAATKNHVLSVSTTKIKKHRQAALSVWEEYDSVKESAQSIAHPRFTVSFQQVKQVDESGEIKTFAPWAGACVAVGMQCAGFYKTITNKLANIVDFVDPSGFDSGNPDNIEDAIDAGLLFVEKDISGNKWVVDQTTYGFDGNFVYNSMQAIYNSDLLALDLAASCQRRIVGESLADLDLAVIKGFIRTKMNKYRDTKLITRSDDAEVGYKNLMVSISGSVVNVSIEIKLSTGVLFVPITLEFSEVTRNG